MGSAAAAPQPHGAGGARGSQTAGHILGPRGRALSVPGPENGPDPGRQEEKGRQAEGKERRKAKAGKEERKRKHEEEAFRRASLERTASG